MGGKLKEFVRKHFCFVSEPYLGFPQQILISLFITRIINETVGAEDVQFSKTTGNYMPWGIPFCRSFLINSFYINKYISFFTILIAEFHT